jgi:hypothetical protein
MLNRRGAVDAEIDRLSLQPSPENYRRLKKKVADPIPDVER